MYIVIGIEIKRSGTIKENEMAENFNTLLYFGLLNPIDLNALFNP